MLVDAKMYEIANEECAIRILHYFHPTKNKLCINVYYRFLSGEFELYRTLLEPISRLNYNDDQIIWLTYMALIRDLIPEHIEIYVA